MRSIADRVVLQKPSVSRSDGMSRFLELWWNVVELTVLDLQRRIRGGLEGRVHDIGQSWKVRSPWIVGGKALVLRRYGLRKVSLNLKSDSQLQRGTSRICSARALSLISE